MFSDVERQNMVIHGMQEKFKRIKLTEKEENPGEGYEDYGVEQRPNVSAEDVINSAQATHRPDPGLCHSHFKYLIGKKEVGQK